MKMILKDYLFIKKFRMNIKFIEIHQSEPYQKFLYFYNKANNQNQPNIEAVSISSYDSKLKEVNSRLVNLKYIKNDNWIFFSNYHSPKSIEFKMHNQVSALLFWNAINVQIRIKAIIEKTPTIFSDEHFLKRSFKKNASAISSNQSQKIRSYQDVVKNYDEVYRNKSHGKQRPSYWGGYSFKPYVFEFWEGKNSRLNKRNQYEFINNKWLNSILEP